MPKKSLLTLFVLALSISTANVLAADLEKMPIIAQWKGGFSQTIITKYADFSDGVACYVLSPTVMGTNYGSGDVKFDANNAGSISCVKVLDSKQKGESGHKSEKGK